MEILSRRLACAVRRKPLPMTCAAIFEPRRLAPVRAARWSGLLTLALAAGLMTPAGAQPLPSKGPPPAPAQPASPPAVQETPSAPVPPSASQALRGALGAAAAAPKLPPVPSFWDPRRRPERPDISRINLIRFMTEVDYPPF